MTLAVWLPVAMAVLWVATQPGLFGRRRRKDARPIRDEAFDDLFRALNDFYAVVAALRPEWQRAWEQREQMELPKSLSFGPDWVSAAGRDMRFALALLHRYRWKSRVSPLFADYDERSWIQLRAASTSLSPQLLALADQHRDALYLDEIDWINAAAAEMDEVSRRRRKSEHDEMVIHQLIAETSYAATMAAINLSERLLARLRHEATGEA